MASARLGIAWVQASGMPLPATVASTSAADTCKQRHSGWVKTSVRAGWRARPWLTGYGQTHTASRVGSSPARHLSVALARQHPREEAIHRCGDFGGCVGARLPAAPLLLRVEVGDGGSEHGAQEVLDAELLRGKRQPVRPCADTASSDPTI